MADVFPDEPGIENSLEKLARNAAWLMEDIDVIRAAARAAALALQAGGVGEAAVAAARAAELARDGGARGVRYPGGAVRRRPAGSSRSPQPAGPPSGPGSCGPWDRADPSAPPEPETDGRIADEAALIVAALRRRGDRPEDVDRAYTRLGRWLGTARGQEFVQIAGLIGLVIAVLGVVRDFAADGWTGDAAPPQPPAVVVVEVDVPDATIEDAVDRSVRRLLEEKATEAG